MIAIPRYQHVSSGGLALLVHGLFFLAMVVGVSWKNLPQLPVEAELWAALPEPAPPVVEPLPEPPPPLPEPVAAPKLEPVAPEAPKPEVAKPEVAKPEVPDIALEQEKQRRAEAARQAELKKQEALKRQAEEAARLEQARLEQERVERERLEQERQEKLKREQVRRQVEQEVARQMQEALDAEAAQLRAVQARAQAARRASTIDDFKRRIQVKIQSYVRLPAKLAGNPEAEFRVTLLPNGEVLRATLVRSSGQSAYDVEVERAIIKASPLPLPNEKEIAASFRDDLTLRFRPFDDARRVN